MAAAAALVSGASAWGQAPAWVEPAATTFRAAPDAPGLRGAAVANRAAAAATRVGAVAAALRQRGVAPGTADSLVELTGGEAGNGANGFTHVRLQQHLGGIPIHGSSVRSTFDARGELVHQIERVVPVEGVVPRPASVDESVALAAAMARVLPGVSVNFSRGARQGLRQKFAGGSFFHQDPEVSRVLVPMADGSLAHGYLVETWTQRGNQLRHTLVSGDGQVLQVQNRTASDSYNVFAIDPGKGPQTVTSGPGTSGTWSPAGWLNSGSQTTNRIVGNNADVYLDTNDNNGPDKGGSSVTTGNFTTAADLTQTPTTTANKAVSVQNMFFHINRIHDVLYSYGFNEAAGNFQSNNFGKGGVGGDPVNGEAQDGGGMDNANFSAPNDGSRGRMQMYLQHGAGPTHEVVVGGSAYGAKGAEFGTQLSTTGIADNLVAALDGSGTSTDACQALTNAAAVSGKFALVDRGNCDFTVKFQNVSNAGAVGMIVINNAATEPFTMTGTSSINKPAVMVSQADGATLRGLIGSVATMRKKAVQPLMRDGGLDADLIYHEYGHGLTWRMVGNMSGPFGGAIGEGAGDVLAFLMNGDDRFVEWASSAPNGWRRYPYGSHPLTYGAVQGLEVHNDGEIYAAAMWRLRELWLNSGRSNATLFAAWVNGMNYAVSAPRHEDMRNALLDSIAFTGGADATARCALVWQAFAQRGIGDGARGTLNADNSVTVQESFATRSNCTH